MVGGKSITSMKSGSLGPLGGIGQHWHLSGRRRQFIQTVMSVMPFGVLGLLNFNSSPVSSVIVLFWLGVAATLAKVLASKLYRHYLAVLANRVRTVVGDG